MDDATLWSRMLAAGELAPGRTPCGIGEQSEKTIHAMLKAAYAPDPAHREVPVGDYIADVYDGERIVEIQTAAFARLGKKLPALLTVAPVTVVYPMPGVRYLTWVDPLSGEETKPRNCGRRHTPLTALEELSYIRDFLSDPRLTVELLFFDLDEYRLRCGRRMDGKKGSRRIERIPRCLRERVILRSPDDYAALLPPSLPPYFNAAEFGKAAHLRGRGAYAAVHLLESVGVLHALSAAEKEEAALPGRARYYSLA